MQDDHRCSPIGGLFRFAKNLFFLACVLIALLAVVGYTAGWVKWQHDQQQDKATI